MKTYFYVNARTVRDESGKPHARFGIDAITEKGIVQNSVIDVFDTFEQAEAFAQLCTELQLAPEHFYDAVEDILLS